MFPSQIDRIVLDSNVSPQSYYHKLGTGSAADLDKAFERFFELCAKAGKDKANKPNCPWAVQGQSGSQLTRKFNTFLETSTAEQSNTIHNKLFNILYKPSDFKKFAQKLQSWYEATSKIPKPGSTDDQDDTYGKRKRQNTFQPKTYKTVVTTNAISGISCGDRITRFKGSADNFKKWLQEYRSITEYGYDLSSAGDLRYSVWKIIANQRFDVPESGIDTKNPILFVNTPYDPVTPMISAKDSTKSFIKAGILRSSSVGHCSTDNRSKKLNEAVKSYMITGEIPKVTQYDPDTENVFDEEPEAPAVNAGVHRKRVYRYPSFFFKREEAASAQQILVDCTKIAVASCAATPLSTLVSLSAAASQSMSISISASISVSELHAPTSTASVSVFVSASKSSVFFHLESASASILVHKSSSILVQASSASAVSDAESQTVNPTPSASAHSESHFASVAHAVPSSVQKSEITPSSSASNDEKQSFPSSSVAVSGSVSASDLPSAS
ncbi:hypothetical protein EKO04_000990 [Ascochyta lentis]|uniref:Peptidase S33 tripeptidyl aminopeptidase-like C-terminal domain-containing protein n=1 Tax=Ascochyta lentis TaxID=205686 RepID=A0A8H7JES3_9PLEO|nr:hypothetical protein EKO04_000990 [Ascochyta lentis]